MCCEEGERERESEREIKERGGRRERAAGGGGREERASHIL